MKTFTRNYKEYPNTAKGIIIEDITQEIARILADYNKVDFSVCFEVEYLPDSCEDKITGTLNIDYAL